MAYRLAVSLDRMRTQFNAAVPHRSKASDGWIGDARHQAATSDHNPWIKDGRMGIVTALDITHDPRNGVDTYRVAENLRQKADPRIKYVISNGLIFSATSAPWTWRRYTGTNPHRTHLHVSVKSTKAHYDNVTDWDLGLGAAEPTAPDPEPDTPSSRPILRVGSEGEDVRHLQTILVVRVDGAFGPITESVVRDFQTKQQLIVDGVVGPQTWAALDGIQQIPLVYEATPRELSERLEAAA